MTGRERKEGEGRERVGGCEDCWRGKREREWVRNGRGVLLAELTSMDWSRRLVFTSKMSRLAPQAPTR